MAPNPKVRALFRLEDASGRDEDEVTVQTKDLVRVIDWLYHLRDEKESRWADLEDAHARRTSRVQL